MAACNFSGLRGISHRVFIIGLSVLLLVQLLVSLTVPRANGSASTSADEPAFLVISIAQNDGSLSPGVRRNERAVESGVLGLWTDEDSSLTGYEDEGPQASSREMILQPWASEQPSFFAELLRLTQFITTTEAHTLTITLPGSIVTVSHSNKQLHFIKMYFKRMISGFFFHALQVNCSAVQNSDGNPSKRSPGVPDVLCINHWKGKEGCVAYSFSLDGKDAGFLDTMLYAGCEVHRFDPSGRGGREPAYIKNHRAWLDWRNPRSLSLGNVQRRLLDIMDALGHTTVDVLRMDLESAEWRILDSWIKDGTLKRINQLILTVHLQWAGFEVGGAEEEVVRFWYSVLRALRISGLRLVRSTHGPGHTVLRHKLANSHSSYTLSWMRTREQPG